MIRAGDIAAEVVAEVSVSSFAAEVSELEFAHALRCAVTDEAVAIVSVLRGERLILDLAPARASIELVRIVAERGIAVTALESVYRTLERRLCLSLLQLVDDVLAARGGGVYDLLGAPHGLVLASADRLLDAVRAEHERRSNRLSADARPTAGEGRRRALDHALHGAIDGAVGDLERALGYRIEQQHHFFILLYGWMGARPLDYLGDVVEASGSTSSFTALEAGTRWALWLGRRDGFAETDVARVRRCLSARKAVSAVVAEPGYGLAGFRGTRMRALEVMQIREALGTEREGTIWASELRLEALLLRDRGAARDFMHEELGPLAGGGSKLAGLRAALLAWLDTGALVSAAAQLGVHENTVRGRIRDAEAMLRGGVNNRRAELHVALRLSRVLGSNDTQLPAWAVAT